jgi:hypothetical protein
MLSRVRDRDKDLRDAIQRIAVEWPSYGRPGITRTAESFWFDLS